MLPVRPARDLSLEQAVISPLAEPTITFINPALGPNEAPVKLIVFSEFFCPACRQLADSLKVVQQSLTGQTQIIWKNLPNDSLHPLATSAAVAAHCAHQQNKFWPFHDLLFARQAYLTQDQIILIAQETELDFDLFISCFNNQDTLPIVAKDLVEAQALGLTASPTIFINGQQFTGAISTQSLIQYVSQTLEK